MFKTVDNSIKPLCPGAYYSELLFMITHAKWSTLIIKVNYNCGSWSGINPGNLNKQSPKNSLRKQKGVKILYTDILMD